MRKLAIIVAPAVGFVGELSGIEDLRRVVSDRVANGEAWEGETAVRLPRSVMRRLRPHVYNSYGTAVQLRRPARTPNVWREGSDQSPAPARFWIVRYVICDADDYSTATCAVVEAASANAAEGHAERCIEGGGPEFWGEAADWDLPEHAGDAAYYTSRPCDCGEDGCEDGEHESRTATVTLCGAEPRGYATQEEACAVAERDFRHRASDRLTLSAVDD